MGDETDSAKKLDAAPLPPATINVQAPIDPEALLIELGLWTEDHESTALAIELEVFADWMIKSRGHAGQYSGIDAYQQALCWIIENKDNCLERRATYSTTKQWLLWLVGKVIDQLGRHPLSPLDDKTPDPSGVPDEIEAQVAAQLLLEKIDAAIKNTEFEPLVMAIELRKDHKALADVLGLPDVPSVRRLLARFKRFIDDNFRS